MTVIRPYADPDFEEVHAIINEAAQAYRGAIPADRWHEPYMPPEDLRREIASGVRFSVLEEGGRIIGAMGVQRVRDATLIRHAYVRKLAQGKGVGGALIGHLLENSPRPVMVGTWAAAQWAIRFYERHGFRLVPQEERDRLLTTYWAIPDWQREASVVLVLEEGHGVDKPITFGEIDSFITMLLAACEDRGMNDTLEMLLSQPDAVRKSVVSRLLDRLRETGGPQSLIEALTCLLDDQVAEKAYEVIFKCARTLKEAKR